MGEYVNIREKAGGLANACKGHLQSFGVLQDDFPAALGSALVSGEKTDAC